MCSRNGVVLALGGWLAACSSPGRQAAWETAERQDQAATQTSSVATATLEAAALESWSKRDHQDELVRAIETWERITSADPSNSVALTSLSRAYYFLADAYLALEEGEQQEQELATYEKGVNAGEKALLILEPEFEKAMRAGADFKDAIVKIGVPGKASAYWYCANLGRFATRKGLSARLFYKDRIKAAMERVMELDRQFFYAGADRYLGAFYAALPSIAGKDLDKSKQHFEEAVKRAPEYLPTKLVQAQFLAVELDDRAMYESLLKDVQAGAETENPDIAPENRAAKRTAEKMLSQIDERF